MSNRRTGAAGSRPLVPKTQEGADASGINDVQVVENGIVHAVDRLHGGLYILELNI